MHFHNKRNFTKQYFELGSTALKVEINKLFESLEYEVSYEQIGHKKIIQTSFNTSLFYGGIFIFFFSLLFMFGDRFELTFLFGFLAFLMMFIAFISREKTITISTYDQPIILYFRNHNKASVIAFADQMIEAANQFLLTKYSKIDRLLPIDPQINQLQFLRNREIISEETYEKLKDQLYGKENKKGIGFTRANGISE